MYFDTKSYLKGNPSHTAKHILKDVLNLRLEAPTAHHAFCGTKNYHQEL